MVCARARMSSFTYSPRRTSPVRDPTARRDAGSRTSSRPGAQGRADTSGESSIFEDEFARVLRHTIDANFVVQMRTRRATGIPHRGHRLSAANAVPGLDGDFGEVSVARLDAVPVVDHED